MGRKRTGSIRVRGGRWYARFTLRSGKEWEHPVDPPTDGGAYDERYARGVLEGLLSLYAAGKWDPEKPKPAGTLSAQSTVLEFALDWIDKQTYESAPSDKKNLKAYLRPSEFGELKLCDVRAKDALAWVYWLKARKSARGGTLAPRTIRNAFDVVRRALDEALVVELLSANPCTPVRGKLPGIEDKHPAARSTWVLPRDAVYKLVCSETIRAERRIRYAILLLTGMRFGEFNALRWSDWDREAAPLTKLTVSRAIKSVSKREGSTKTGAVKRVPVHPELEMLLCWWWDSGWQQTYGRAPTQNDLVAPAARGKNKGAPSNSTACNRGWKADQRALGIDPPRHQHCARHTLITHAQDDGADGSILRWATHAPPRTGFDGYTRIEWESLCNELSKLKIQPPPLSNPGK